MTRLTIPVFLLFIGLRCSMAQINVGGLLKEKAKEVQQKAKEKALDRTEETWEKKRAEYDESNFNYAISFLDNSGLFEADEKGNAFANSVLGGVKLVNKEEKTVEERAYTNLKNGEVLMASNKYYLAEQSFKLAKVLYEQDGKTSTGNYAQTISNLGLLYQSRGRYTKAKVFNEQAIVLREKGDNKNMLLVSINNNAVLKKETGFYVEAEKDFKQVVKAADEQKNSLAKALVENNLAMTYLDMNKLKDAESHMNKALEEAAKVLEESSSNFIKLQINLANIYRFQKKYTDAEIVYLKAIQLKEKKLGAHPDLAHLKKGLAQLYMEMGKTGEVEKLLLSALDIDKRKLGEKNPATVAVEHELANFYRYNNSNPKSLDLITKVVGKKKIIFGEAHPSYIQALEDLALTQWQGNRITEAKTNYGKVIDNTLLYIRGFFASLNENEKTLYWTKTNARLQRYFSFLLANSKNDADLVTQMYSTSINTKGFLLNNSNKIRAVIFSGKDEDLKNTYAQWLETKENLNMAYQLSKEELAEENINLDSLTQREEELERLLSQKSAAFKEDNNEQAIDVKKIQAALQTKECAIEIIELGEYKNGFTSNENYIALVVKQSGVQLVNLGDGKTIQQAVTEFRKKVTHAMPENEAYMLTWKALETSLKDINKIYLSLDGVYHQLSINALKDGAGKYLVDTYNLQFVGNTRDVLSLKASESAVQKPGTAFLVGNPNYGSNGYLEQLPGAELEVKNINTLLLKYKLKTTSLVGAKATEEKVKQLDSPSILHIATHGYFLADINAMETTKVLGVDITAAKENPLLRSGLLLANCDNVFEEGYRPAHNSENGVLTAYEAMSLNLDNTDLVVLSACETGLGEVKQGEGVYGLQRSFLIAGAKSVVMSLWSVSDDATMELMTMFYNNYAKTGNKNQAFNDAVKQLKIKYKEPFYWSAFVMLNK